MRNMDCEWEIKAPCKNIRVDLEYDFQREPYTTEPRFDLFFSNGLIIGKGWKIKAKQSIWQLF